MQGDSFLRCWLLRILVDVPDILTEYRSRMRHGKATYNCVVPTDPRGLDQLEQGYELDEYQKSQRRKRDSGSV